MNNVINIVIDLETVSLKSDAAIVSIGATTFIPDAVIVSDEPVEFGVFDAVIGTDIPATFEAVVNVMSCITAGLDTDGATCKWWSERSDEAKASVLATPVLLSSALEALSDWIGVLRGKFGAVKIWCQGTDFDIPILTNAYRACGLPLPWKYREVRDARSHFLESVGRFYEVDDDIYDLVPDMPDGEEWVKHSALSDARRTAWSVAYANDLTRRYLEGSPEYRALMELKNAKEVAPAE